VSKIIKIRTIPQLIANNMSGNFFSETRCNHKNTHTHIIHVLHGRRRSHH